MMKFWVTVGLQVRIYSLQTIYGQHSTDRLLAKQIKSWTSAVYQHFRKPRIVREGDISGTFYCIKRRLLRGRGQGRYQLPLSGAFYRRPWDYFYHVNT